MFLLRGYARIDGIKEIVQKVRIQLGFEGLDLALQGLLFHDDGADLEGFQRGENKWTVKIVGSRPLIYPAQIGFGGIHSDKNIAQAARILAGTGVRWQGVTVKYSSIVSAQNVVDHRWIAGLHDDLPGTEFITKASRVEDNPHRTCRVGPHIGLEGLNRSIDDIGKLSPFDDGLIFADIYLIVWI